jgi:hypothetical protein
LTFFANQKIITLICQHFQMFADPSGHSVEYERVNSAYRPSHNAMSGSGRQFKLLYDWNVAKDPITSRSGLTAHFEDHRCFGYIVHPMIFMLER